MVKHYLYDYYGVKSEDYKGIRADVLELPVRVVGRFHMHQVNTIEDLLLLSWEDIDKWYGFGRGCKEALEKSLKNYLGQTVPVSPINVSASVSNMLREAFSAWVPIDEQGNSYTLKMHNLINKYNCAISSLEEDDIRFMLSNLEYSRFITNSLLSISNELLANQVTENILASLPNQVRLMSAYKALSLYTEDASFVYSMINEDEDNVPFEEILKKNILEWQNSASFIEYKKWVLLNLENETAKLFENEKFSERIIDVLTERANWSTLEQVGQKIGVTRERIRQIEAKGIRFISFWNLKNRISRLVKMRCLEDGIVFSDDLAALFGKYGSIMLHFFRTEANLGIRYSREYDAFVVCEEEVLTKVQQNVDNMPDVFSVVELDNLLKEADYPKLLYAEILSQYKSSGDVYHRSRLTMSSVYADVLRTEFPKGIHIYDDSEMNNFRKKVEDKYGDIKISANNRAMGVRIADIGILCGRGIYKPKQESYITDELASKIYEYIMNGDSPAYLMHTIFEVFKYDLLFQGIDNRYYLQGVLREIFGDKLFFRRDYVIKDINFTNISYAIIDYIKKSRGPVTKHELYGHFPGITEIIINLSVTDSSIINLFGSYLSTSQIDLNKDEIDFIRGVVDEMTSDNKSIHCKDIYEAICNENKLILSRNYVVQPFGMFGLLEYLFSDDYNFVRPFISRKNVDIEKTIDSLYAKVNEADVIDLEEISTIAREKHFQINSLTVFANACNDTHYLISNHQLASIDYLGFDENDFPLIEKTILESISGTVPINSLTCIHLFPKLEIKWNEWIIYSVVNKLSELLDVGLSSNQIRMAVPFIAPKGQLKIDDSIISTSSVQDIFIADDMDDIDSLVEKYIGEEINF